MTAPRRLVEGGGVMPPELMRALNGAPGEPTHRDLAALATTLSGALGVALPLPAVAKALQAGGAKAALCGSATVGVSAAKPLAALGAWVVGGLALGAGLSGVAAYSFATTDGPAPQARPAASAAVRATLSQPPVVAPEAPMAAPSAAPIVDVHAVPLAPLSPRAASTSPTPEPTSRESEISLLKRAREASQANPAQALALSSEHAKLYPGGALEQEREVIAIDALLRLGRQSEAAERAKQFQARYPGSAHARRLSTLLTGG